MEGKKEQHKNQQQCDRNGNRQPYLCSLKILELTAVRDVISCWQFDLLIDLPGDFANHVLHIPVTDIESDRYPSFGVFPGNLGRTRFNPYIGNLIKRNLSTIGKGNREIFNIVQALAVILIQPDYQTETFLFIEHHSCLTTCKGCTKNTVHILNRKTILRQSVPVVIDLHLC